MASSYIVRPIWLKQFYQVWIYQFMLAFLPPLWCGVCLLVGKLVKSFEVWLDSSMPMTWYRYDQEF